MRPRKESKRRNTGSSPTRDRTTNTPGFDKNPSRLSPPSASLLDREIITQDLDLFASLQISPEETSSPNPNPRSFPYSVKQQCWEKAEKVKGRDPDRWRRDHLGNTLFRKLVGCPGCLCHDYDHIVPYSKVVLLFFFSILHYFDCYFVGVVCFLAAFLFYNKLTSFEVGDNL